MESSTIFVIPCYNEAPRFQVPKFKEFSCRKPAVRFLFVDDGSTDGTGQVLEGLHREDHLPFAICYLSENKGKAEAVRQGGLARV